MIGYAVFVFGAVFYAFTITNLLTEISNFEVLFRGGKLRQVIPQNC